MVPDALHRLICQIRPVFAKAAKIDFQLLTEFLGWEPEAKNKLTILRTCSPRQSAHILPNAFGILRPRGAKVWMRVATSAVLLLDANNTPRSSRCFS